MPEPGLITPEARALLEQLPEGSELHLHVHHAPAQAVPEPGGLRETLRTVARPAGQIVKWGTAPIWWPIRGIARDIVAAPRRTRDALLEPWAQEVEAFKARREAFRALSQEERETNLAVGRGQAILAMLLMFSILVLPGSWKWIPILALLAHRATEAAWCPVRAYLGEPQGGLEAWRPAAKATLAQVRHGGFLGHRKALQAEAQAKAEKAEREAA